MDHAGKVKGQFKAQPRDSGKAFKKTSFAKPWQNRDSNSKSYTKHEVQMLLKRNGELQKAKEEENFNMEQAAYDGMHNDVEVLMDLKDSETLDSELASLFQE